MTTRLLGAGAAVLAAGCLLTASCLLAAGCSICEDTTLRRIEARSGAVLVFERSCGATVDFVTGVVYQGPLAKTEIVLVKGRIPLVVEVAADRVSIALPKDVSEKDIFLKRSSLPIGRIEVRRIP